MNRFYALYSADGFLLQRFMLEALCALSLIECFFVYYGLGYLSDKDGERLNEGIGQLNNCL